MNNMPRLRLRNALTVGTPRLPTMTLIIVSNKSATSMRELACDHVTL
jgi:hypothetical protein